MMYTMRIDILNLESRRLDTDFYQPDAVNALHKIIRFKPLRMDEVGIVWNFGAYELCNQIRISYDDKAPVFISISDISEPFIDIAKSLRVTDYTHEILKAARVEPNDILVSIAGTIGKCGIVPSHSFRGASANQALVKFRPARVDSYYALAYFTSNYFKLVLGREAGGAVQKNLYLNNFASLPIFILSPFAQSYIGDKVRQAERLRAQARESKKKAREIFNEALDWSNQITARVLSRRLPPNKLGGRLDLNFNSPRKYELLDHIESRKIRTDQLNKLVDISAMIGWKGLTTEHYVEVGPWLLRGVEFDKGIIDFDSLVCVEKAKYDEQPQIHLRAGDVALTKDGTLGKAICIPRLSKEIAAGSTVARLRPKNDSINPFYLEFVLNHEVLQIQIQSYATGLAQPHITQEWITQLLIPRIERERSISFFVMQHHEYAIASKLLVTAAKIIVESLIEGQITESDLIAAQKALEAGDREPDRAILSRLTRRGMDVSGDLPLFPDLDGLYNALDEIDTPQEAP